MFRSSQRNSKRSEIVMMITPHILNKTRPTPVINTTSFASPESDELQGGSR
jgi:type II secretory pathway component GspD/PulD (secretin)